MKHELIGKGEIIPLGLFGVVKAKHQSVLFNLAKYNCVSTTTFAMRQLNNKQDHDLILIKRHLSISARNLKNSKIYLRKLQQ
jgi:hypothetical protein